VPNLGVKPPNAGKGRPKGVPNKATAAVREAIADFAAANVEKLQAWLDKTAEKHPDKAAELFLRALEYHIPKISRTQLSGEVVNTEVQVHRVMFVNADGTEVSRAISGEAIPLVRS